MYVTMHANLGNVMAHIVDHSHVEVIWTGIKNLGKGLAAHKRHAAAIDPCKIGSTCHASQVRLALWTVDACTGKLRVVEVEILQRR